MFNHTEIIELLDGKNDEWLFDTAHQKKQAIYGDRVFLRGIIETSSHCDRDCSHCALRVSNKDIERHRLDLDIIVKIAETIAQNGISSIVLQGGEDSSEENIRLITKAIRAIKHITKADIAISMGEMPKEIYAEWKNAGADRYLLKLEVMDPTLYEKVRPGGSYENRLKCLKTLIDLGYQVGTGFTFGLPEYDNHMLAHDMLELSQMGVHMFSLTPFINTNDKIEQPDGDAQIIHRANAIYRLLDPEVNIPVTTAMSSLDANAKQRGLLSGCNVLMHYFTPNQTRNRCAVYQSSGVVHGETLGRLEDTVKMILSLGLTVSRGEPGRSKKKTVRG